MRLYRILFNTSGEGGGGGNSPTPTPTPTPTGTDPEITKRLDAILAKHGGDPNAALRIVIADRDGLRDQLSEVKAKLPKDGVVILADDDVKTWEAYKALGKPDEVSTALTAGKDAATKVALHEREKVVKKAAQLAGYDPEVLAQLGGDIAIEFKPGKDKAGKDIEVPHVKDGDKLVSLEEHAKAKWAKFLPSLKATDAATPPPDRGSPGAARQFNPAPNPQQPRRSLVH